MAQFCAHLNLNFKCNCDAARKTLNAIFSKTSFVRIHFIILLFPNPSSIGSGHFKYQA
jgi:hypothetical protein